MSKIPMQEKNEIQIFKRTWNHKMLTLTLNSQGWCIETAMGSGLGTL